MRLPLVTLVDHALPEATYATLLAAVRGLGRERLRESYQTTFWWPLDAEPSSLVEAAVPLLRRHIPPERLRGVVGVEWWLSRMRTSNVKVDFHHDRDNAYFDDTGRERCPKLSSVFYLGACRGGLLAVTPEAPNPANPAFAPDHLDFDFVAPAHNRYTFFDGRLTHGVLDARNELPGRRLPTERRWRLGIAINWWTRRPRRVPTFADRRVYRRLGASPFRP